MVGRQLKTNFLSHFFLFHSLEGEYNAPFSDCLFVTVSKRVFVRIHSFENVFQLQVHFHTKQTHFHVKGFTQSLVLKQRHKGTRNSFYGSNQRFNMQTGHCIDSLASLITFVCLSKQLNI